VAVAVQQAANQGSHADDLAGNNRAGAA